MRSQYEILNPASRNITTAFCALAVMAKAPLIGNVKTRLVPPLQPREAAALNTCFLRDVTDVIDKVCVAEQAEGFAAYTPLGQEVCFDGLLPGGFRLLAQRGSNLGERLFHATKDFLAAGFQAMCLINSDSPTLPVAVLDEAVAALRVPGDRVILGPADDGGYYLIGLKHAHRRLFEDIVWSTESVLAGTLDRAREIGLEAKLLPTWYDVDDAASLRRLCQELFSTHGHCGTLAGYAAPHTREYLRRLISCDGWGERLRLEL
jgi:rSAM/selenodomain-associated transferase 1